MATADGNSLEYWKEKAIEYEQRLEANQLEFDEYQESSSALEAELEAQLQQDEKRISELQSRNIRFEQDNHGLQEKLDRLGHDSQLHIDRLESDVQQLSQQCQTLQQYTRELEQTNDDLDRAQRATMQSLSDFEVRLNAALERNALLEGELDEKEALAVMVQRLKDESRDLHQELSVMARASAVRRSSNADRLSSDSPMVVRRQISALAGGSGSFSCSGNSPRPLTRVLSHQTPLTPGLRGDLYAHNGAVRGSTLLSSLTTSGVGTPLAKQEGASRLPRSSSPTSDHNHNHHHQLQEEQVLPQQAKLHPSLSAAPGTSESEPLSASCSSSPLHRPSYGTVSPTPSQASKAGLLCSPPHSPQLAGERKRKRSSGCLAFLCCIDWRSSSPSYEELSETPLD